MERGHRREPVSDRVHPAGGAGSDRAETPGPQLRGGPVGAGCRGRQCHRRGCRNSEGVATPGALAGAAALPFDARAALRSRECPTEGGTRCRFAWAFRGAPRGLRRRPHLPKAHPTTSRRSGRSPARRAGAARAAGVACECGNGDPLLPGLMPLLTHPHRVAGGVQGGRSLLLCAWSEKRKRGSAHWALPLVCL